MLMRPYRSWMSPWRDLERLRRDMNRVLGDMPSQSGWTAAAGYPAMNVWTDEDSAMITAELPGVSLDDIDIAIHDDTLVLRGNRKADDVGEEVTYHRNERRYGNFVRTFRLPFRVDADKVDATLEKGVLTIALPRAEADKPRKISIRTG